MVKYNPSEIKMIRTIAVIFTVGIIGFSIPLTQNIFLHLTPLILSLSLILLYNYDIYNTSKSQKKRIIFYSIVFAVGFLVEMWGVNTGDLFGSYHYGSGLGFKIEGTPLLIGLNWVIMVYLTSAIFSSLRRNPLNNVVFPSLLMVGYDIILEQAAPKMDMWSWQDQVVPLQNFVMWGILAVIFHALRYLMKVTDKNRIALPLFTIMLLFFIFVFLLN